MPPLGPNAVQPLREAAFLHKGRRLCFELAVQQRARHSDEHQRGVRSDLGVDDLVDELRHSTRRLEPGTARSVMRSYGLSFETLPGEPAESNNEPANNAASTTTPAPTT